MHASAGRRARNGNDGAIMTAVITRFADVAATLQRNGYSVVPIAPGTKQCFVTGWTVPHAYTDTEIQKHKDDGCGLLMGSIVGIDIDVRDAKIASAIEDAAIKSFGKTVRRVGSAPKVLLL